MSDGRARPRRPSRLGHPRTGAPVGLASALLGPRTLRLVALVALALAGCSTQDGPRPGSGTGQPPECARNSDCEAAEVCLDTVCVAAQRDCDAASCPDVLADAAEDGPLDLGDTLPGDLEECLRPSDCPEGFRCLDNHCIDETAIGDGGGDPTIDTTADDLGGTDLADLCGGGGCADDPTAEPDLADECEGRGYGRLGDSCGGAADCCNGLCLGNPDVGVGYCTERCAVWDDCNPVGFADEMVCLDVGSGSRLCAFSDYGDNCDLADDCVGQICLKGQGTSGCSIQCSDRNDCPPDAGCGAVFFDDGAGGAFALNVCAPVGTNCAVFETGFNNCLSGTCVTEEVGSTGFCTVFCSTSRSDQCPPGWTCQEVEAGQPAICVQG